MARFFYKCLGWFAFITIAVLWVGCNDDVEQLKIVEKPVADSILQKINLKVQKKDQKARNFDKEYPIDSGNVQIRIAGVRDSSESDGGRLIKEISGIIKAQSSKFFEVYNDYLKKDYWPGGTYRYHVEIGENVHVRKSIAMRQNADFDDLSEKIRKIIEESLAAQSSLNERFFYVTVTFRRGSDDLAYLGDQIGSVHVTAENEEVKISGGVNAVREKDIEISSDASLNARFILHAIRMRYAGLTHVYNKHLQIKPDLNGKIVVTISIAPDGTVGDVFIKSSTTGFDEFDEEIKTTLSRWRFNKSNGTTTVTIPLAFGRKNYLDM